MPTHLYLSPEFAHRLEEMGMLPALISHYRKFIEEKNYPFELEQERIIRQSVFKGLCDYYGKIAKKPSLDQILETTEKIAERLYGKKPKPAVELIWEDLEAYKKKLK